ncbi:MAG: oxidoreductase, partial [Butyrivibrio sp.]|nr:oxidoreductase [Butyrivibrio sp.]
CNSTYTTHDEPRWYDMDSMMYISGLTENDAVMGNDEKFVTDLCLAAKELNPKFIAICASALPAMVGVDMEAIAYEVETETGIPTFEVKTNAMQSYITGAGNAFVELAKRFTEPSKRLNENSDKNIINPKNIITLKVNILGLTPLDFPLHGTTEAIQNLLEANGFIANSFVGMHHTKADHLEEIKRLADADVSLVVSSIGMPVAKYLYEEYGIPYVIGTPYGDKFSKLLIQALKKAAKKSTEKSTESSENINAILANNNNAEAANKNIVIIGESVLSASLATAIYQEFGLPVQVLESVGDGELSVLDDSKDLSCTEEDELEMEIKKADIVIADPLFEPICKGKHFIRLPHAAFSGRCFTKEELHLINVPLADTKLGKQILEY